MLAEGAKVKVVTPALTYSLYLTFLAKYQSEIRDEDLKKFRFGESPAEGDEFTVVFSASHLETDRETICVITNDTNLFMVEQSGLVEIEPPIKVGDKVVITDTGATYSTYEEFVLEHKCQLSSDDFWNFQYNHDMLPSSIENVNRFEVLCIDKYGKEWAKDRLVAIIKDIVDSRVFVINVSALKRVN